MEPRFMRQVVIADQNVWDALSIFALANGMRLAPMPCYDRETPTYRFVYAEGSRM